MQVGEGRGSSPYGTLLAKRENLILLKREPFQKYDAQSDLTLSARHGLLLDIQLKCNLSELWNISVQSSKAGFALFC